MIFVMAASGQVGGRVVAQLLARGAAPSGIVAGGRSPEKMSGFLQRGVTVREADYTRPETLRSAFAGVDTLVLIPTTSAVAPRVQEHANALESARAAGVRRVLFLSLVSAQPESRSLVAPFILYAEAATRQSGMQWLLLRMNLYLDPLVDWAPELATTGRLPYPIESGRVAYVTRDDVARALAAAALDPDLAGEVLELTGPEAVAMDELAGWIGEATGSTIRYEPVSDEEFAALCRESKTPEYITRVLISLYHAVDGGEFDTVSKDIERLTGRSPESARDFLVRSLRKR